MSGSWPATAVRRTSQHPRRHRAHRVFPPPSSVIPVAVHTPSSRVTYCQPTCLWFLYPDRLHPPQPLQRLHTLQPLHPSLCRRPQVPSDHPTPR